MKCKAINKYDVVDKLDVEMELLRLGKKKNELAVEVGINHVTMSVWFREGFHRFDRSDRVRAAMGRLGSTKFVV